MLSLVSATSRFQKECSRAPVQARSTSATTQCLKTSALRRTSRGASTCPLRRAIRPCHRTVLNPPSGRTRRHDPRTLRTMHPRRTPLRITRTRHQEVLTSPLTTLRGRSPPTNPRWAIMHLRSRRTLRIPLHPLASCRRSMIRDWPCIAILHPTRSLRRRLLSLVLLLGRSLRHSHPHRVPHYPSRSRVRSSRRCQTSRSSSPSLIFRVSSPKGASSGIRWTSSTSSGSRRRTRSRTAIRGRAPRRTTASARTRRSRRSWTRGGDLSLTSPIPISSRARLYYCLPRSKRGRTFRHPPIPGPVEAPPPLPSGVSGRWRRRWAP